MGFQINYSTGHTVSTNAWTVEGAQNVADFWLAELGLPAGTTYEIVAV